MEQFCQSCGMPLSSEVLGTNADNSANQDYCKHCYQEGKFVAPDITMDEMIDFCAKMMAENDPTQTYDGLVSMMDGYFPQMKRWKH